MAKLTEAQYEVIFSGYAAGISIAQLGRDNGVAEQTIWKALSRRGLIVRRRKSGHKLTETEILTAVGLYQVGKTTKEIAGQLDCTEQAVDRHLRLRGILLGHAAKKLARVPQAVRDQIAALYITGKTGDQIVAIINNPLATRAVVYSELQRRRLTNNSAGNHNRGLFTDQPDKKSEIVRLYQSGWSVTALAQNNECSADPIKKVLRDHGVEVRSFDEATGFKWSDKNGRVFHMRSMWEIKTAIWLDQQDLKWNYEECGYDIGDGHVYTPDFWLYDSTNTLTKIIDVKGWLRPKSGEAIEKFKLTQPTLPFEMWDEAALDAKGILAIVVPGDTVAPGPNVPSHVNATTEPERDSIAALYTSGLTVMQTAAKSGRSHTTVEEILTERNLLRGKAKSRLLRVPQEVRDEIARLYSTGLSVSAVSKELKVGRDVVYGEITRRGISRSREKTA